MVVYQQSDRTEFIYILYIKSIMDELTNYLNRNVSSIIINYLTDLPKLPYLDELKYRTQRVYNDVDWSYRDHYISRYKHKIVLKTRIRRDERDGSIYIRSYYAKNSEFEGILFTR